MLEVAGSKWFRRLLVVVCVVAVLAIAATFILSHTVKSTKSNQHTNSAISNKLPSSTPSATPSAQSSVAPLLPPPPDVYWYSTKHIVLPDAETARYIARKLRLDIKIPEVEGFKVVFVDIVLDNGKVVDYEITMIPDAYYSKFVQLVKKVTGIDPRELRMKILTATSLDNVKGLMYKYWKFFFGGSNWLCVFRPDYDKLMNKMIPNIGIDVYYSEFINRGIKPTPNCRELNIKGVRALFCTDLKYYMCINDKCTVTNMPNTAYLFVPSYEKYGKDIWITACLASYKIDKTKLERILTKIAQELLG